MAISQAGTTVTGIQLPAAIEVGGMTTVTTGTVTGSVSGGAVSLRLDETVTVTRRGETVICRGADSFAGQVSGDVLAGILISGTTRYVCEGGISLPTPQISGPMIFTRRQGAGQRATATPSSSTVEGKRPRDATGRQAGNLQFRAREIGPRRQGLERDDRLRQSPAIATG